jgi:hypothetical protein
MVLSKSGWAIAWPFVLFPTATSGRFVAAGAFTT